MLAAVALACAFFAWLVISDGIFGIAAVTSPLTAGVLALAASGLMGTYVLRALRVYYEFADVTKGRFGVCLRIVLFHNAWVNLLPMRSGELAFPLLLRRHFGVSIERSSASLLWLRLQDAVVLSALGLMVWPGLSVASRVTALLALAALALGLPWWAAKAGRGSAVAGPTHWVLRVKNALADSAHHAQIGWLWTLANWGVKLAVQAWLLGQVLALPIQIGAAGALGGELAAIFPLQGVAGFGSYEAGAALAMVPSGVPFERGLQAALVLHLFVLATALTTAALAWLLFSPTRQAPFKSSAKQPID